MDFNQFNPYALSHAVYLIYKKVLKSCPIMSNIFMRMVGENSINVSWDIITGSATIMRALDIYSPAFVGTQTNEKTVTARLPKLHELRPVEADGTLLLTRQPGDRSRGTRRLRHKIATEQFDLVQKFIRTVEYMGGQSLRGSIMMVDEHGNPVEVANWNLPDDNTPARYGGSQAWTHADSDPAQDVDDLKTVIRQSTRGGVEKWIMFAGTKVNSAVRTNKNLRGDSKRLKAKDVAEELEIDTYIHYPDTYEDNTGSWVPLVGKDEFILVGYAPQYYSLIYLYLNDILNLSAQMGAQSVGMGMMGGMDDMLKQEKLSDKDIDKMVLASEFFLKRNPRICEVSVEGYPLPVCHAPGSTAIVQPVSQ